MKHFSIQTGKVLFSAITSAMCVLGISKPADAILAVVQLAPLGTVLNGTSGTYGSSAIDGTTSYDVLTNGSNTPQIGEITGLGSTLSSGTFVSNTTLNNINVSTGISGQLYNDGSNLQILDSISSQVIRVPKSDGTAAAVYTTKNQILAATGQTSLTVSGSTLTSTGDCAFYDLKSHAIWQTTGLSGTTGLTAGVVPLISNASLLSTTNGGPANQTVSGFAVVNTEVIEANSSKGIYATTDGGTTWSQIFTPGNIEGITGGGTVAFLATSFYYAPDNNIYFYDGTSKDILDFDPTNPSATLGVAVAGTQVAGIEGTPIGSSATTVNNLTWYNGNIAWDDVNSNPTAGGLYAAVPEPTSMSLLIVGAAGLTRRRRSNA